MNRYSAYPQPVPGGCSVEACDRKATRTGVCELHQKRFNRTGTYAGALALRPKVCKVQGCVRPVHGNSMCCTHNRRYRLYGDPLGGRTFNGEREEFIRNVVMTHEGEECLFWPFGGSTSGYISQMWEGRTQSVHRIACEALNGPPPTPEHEAAHSCGKGDSSCVNRNHLRWETRVGNASDKFIHGTSSRGSGNGSAKLTEDKVRAIRAMLGGHSHAEIAAKFGVSKYAIRNVANGSTWGWLV